MQIIPSILEKTPQDLFYQINRLSPYFSRFQIDIADGIFVPNRIVQIEEIEDSLKEDCLNKDSLQFDFHLMVKNYQAEIKKIEKLAKFINIKYIFIHFSAVPDFKSFKTDFTSFPVGLTLNPQEQVFDLTKSFNLEKMPFLQIMSVVPGYQGSPFVPNVLNKIEQLRKLGFNKEIFLDGAVNGETLPKILEKKYRPDFICPGSYLTKAKILEVNANYLKSLNSKKQ